MRIQRHLVQISVAARLAARNIKLIMAGNIVLQLKPRERASIGDTVLRRNYSIQKRNLWTSIPKVSYLSVSIIFFHHDNIAIKQRKCIVLDAVVNTKGMQTPFQFYSYVTAKRKNMKFE